MNYARQAVTDEALAALVRLARAGALEDAIRAQFSGEPVNVSEQRAALHTALRAPEHSEPQAEVRAAAETRRKMTALVSAVHSGSRVGATGRPFETVLSIGIGGSDLGPRMVCAALGRSRLAARFLSNIDGDALASAVDGLDPETTLVVVISKSFGTQETLTNASGVRRWLVGSLGCTEREAGAHLIAVTARPDRARDLGIDDEAILPMWDWVGGRYSLWSAVGLPVALAAGPEAYAELLSGARAMDEHLLEAPLEANLPVLMGLLSLWNRNVLGLPTHAVVPYSDRLSGLPDYLQQLVMESNGKNATRSGASVERATAPVIWGGAGTDAQHAFFQMLHQGTDRVPVDFVGFVAPDHDHSEHHRLLLANLLAQSEALARGRGRAATEAALREQGLSEADAAEAAAHRLYPGDRPNSVFLLQDLSAHSLGALIAAWEHSVYVQGHLLDINSYDQWGVELGKTIADRIAPLLSGASRDGADPVTAALSERLTI